MSDYKCDFFGQTVKHAMPIKTKDTGIFHSQFSDA